MSTNYHVRTFENSFGEYPYERVTDDELLVLGKLTGTGIDNDGLSVSSYLNLFAYQYPNPLYGLTIVESAYDVEEKQTCMTSWGYRDGTGTDVKFDGPSDCLRIGDYLIIGDNRYLRKYNINTGEVTTIPIFLTDLQENYFSENIRGLSYDGTYVYLTDYYNISPENQGCYILQILPSTTFEGTWTATVFCGNPSSLGYDDGVGQSASFTEIRATCNDGTYLYVADGIKLRRVTLADATVSTLLDSFTCISGVTYYNGVVFTSDSSTSTLSSYTISSSSLVEISDAISFMDISNDGTYVYGTNGNEVSKVLIADGTITSIAGGSASGYADGIGNVARFNGPESLDFYDGNLYICDTVNGMFRKVVVSSGDTTTPAGGFYSTGSSYFFEKNPEMTEEQLKNFLCQTFEDKKVSLGLSDVDDINMVWFYFTLNSLIYFTVFFYVGNDSNADEVIVKT